MSKLGFTGIGIPRQYGGSDGGAVEKIIAVSEFAKKCMSSAAILSIHLIAPQAIYKYGNEEQKQKYLPKLTKGGSRSEEHTSELQSRQYLVCRLLLEKKQTI